MSNRGLVSNGMRNRSERPQVIVFLGAPGVGKGTQAAWLSSRLSIPVLSTGAMLRAEAKQRSAAGMRLRRLLASGSLVADDLVCAAAESQLRDLFSGDGVILDGFPRTVAQARFLGGLSAELGAPAPVVIHLQVSKDSLLRRLSTRRHCSNCGTVYNLSTCPSRRGRVCERDGGALVQRDDDTERVILHRFDEYEKLSAPLVAYYAGTNYYAIDGDRELEQISADLEAMVCGAAVMAA